MNAYKKLSQVIRMLLLVVLVVNTFAPAITLRAQETTPDAPPIETTPETTPVVEAPTEAPPTPTEQPPVVIPTQNPPTAGSLFLADFNTGDTSAFLITGDWAVVGDSATFTTSSPSATAIVNGMLWDNFITVTSVTIAQGGEALIGLRVGAESYAIRISDSGNATLWRGLVQIGGAVAPVAETTPDPLALPAVYEVAISAIGGTLTVAVNNVTQINITDPAPLTSGYVVFGTTAESLGAVGYDNILIQAQVPVSEETPVTPVVPVETPIIIPPLDPTPENTPVVEVTPEATLPVEATETPVVEVTAEATLPVEATLEVTPELTPAVEVTPELTPDVEVTPEVTPELTPEVTETAIPLSLDEAEIAKLDGVIYSLLEAYYAGDEEGALAFATDNYLNWREDGRLQVWVYPYAVENIPAIAATLLELGGEVLYLSDSSIDVVVTLETLVEIARDGRIFAITLPVPAVPTSTGELETNSVGTPQLLATTGTGTVIPHTLDQLGISSWHEANMLGAGVNIAVIDTGFEAGGNSAEQACLGNVIPVFGVGTGNHGLNVVEILCDVAPSSQVWTYTATDASSLATAINTARAGVLVDNIPPADLILITLNPNGTNTALDTAVADAFNNNVPVIASAGNGGAKNTLTFDVTAGGITTLFITGRSGNVITITPTLPGNNTAIQQVGGGYSNNNAGTVPHAYTIGSECGDICQLELVITRDNADTYTITSNWAGATIIPDATVVPNASADELIDYTESYNVLAVGSVCGTQLGRFPLTESSPQGALGQSTTARIKPDIVAPTNVNTSLLGYATISGDFICDGGFSGASASASHVAGMAALVMSNSSMVGIHNATTGRPWQLFSYLKSRALDVNGNGFDRAYGAGVAQLGDPSFNLGFEIISVTAPNNPLLTTENTIYVSSDRLSAYNINDHISTPLYPASDPTIPVPDGTLSNPFTHITEALAYSVSHPLVQHIVLMPGEYPSSFTIPRDNLTLWGYDSADSAPSIIWVSDTINNTGIVINGRTNVTLNGLDFRGATPDYAFTDLSFKIAHVNPVIISNSSNITITNSTFDQFDAPIQVISSQNVVVRENTFTRFVADSGAFGAVLKVVESGSISPVVVERNLFQNNTIPESQSDYRNSVIHIQTSQTHIFGNRIIGNQVPSVVTINMWRVDNIEKVMGRNILYSNVIADNSLTGPVVHLAQGEQFQFINNTVAKNVIDVTLTSNLYLTIIGLGRVGEGSGGFEGFLAQTHKFDIHNNIFFANRDINNSAIELSLVNGLIPEINAFTCKSLITTEGNYARYNWFISSQAYANGICNNAIDAPANGNVFSTIALTTTDIATFASAHFTPLDAHPYRLKDATVEAVDVDSNFALDVLLITGVPATTTLTSKDPAIDLFARDAMGNPRFFDTQTYQKHGVDIGAYEFSDQVPLEFYNNSGDGYSDFNAGSFSFTMTEDGVAQIDMARMVQFGAQPYSIEIVPHVTIYDTNTANACAGQPYDYDPVTYILTYCPLPNFHNQGVTTPESEIRFEYRVTDALGSVTLPSPPAYATMTVKITAVDDGIVVTTSDHFIIDANETLPIYITPTASLTGTGLVLPHASGVDNLDYPFTYSDFGFELTAPDYNYRLTSNINFAEDIVNGVLTYTPPFGVSSGAFELTYVVTDQDGDTATQRVRVVVVDVLETSIYDDTSPRIRYMGDWTPQINSVAYQKTVHTTTDTNASAVFSFMGDNFAIGYRGSTLTGAITITIDQMETEVFTNIYQVAGLSCTPVTPTSGNPIQTQITNRFFIRCSGLNTIASGQIHTIRIANNGANPFLLDWVQVDAQPLAIGFYEDTDLRPYLQAGTYTEDTHSPNGSWEVFNTLGSSQMQFTVMPSVKRILIYRPIDLSRDDLLVSLSGNGCTPRLVDVLGLAPDAMWNIPYMVRLNGCTSITITRKFDATKTLSTGIDSIRLLGDEVALSSPLNIHVSDLVEYMEGRNGEIKEPNAQDGRAHRLMDAIFAFNITADVQSIVLYRQNFTQRDSIKIRTLALDGTTNCTTQTKTVANTDTVGIFSQPIVLNNIGTCRRIEITRVLNTGTANAAPLLERIILLPTTSGALNTGTYDNLALANYFTNSTIIPEAKAGVGSWQQLNTGGALTFTVNPTVKRILVYRPMDYTRDDLQVSLSGNGCTAINVNVGGTAPGAMWNIPQMVRLNGCTNITITRKFTAGQTLPTGIDGIQLLGDAMPLELFTGHSQGDGASMIAPYVTHVSNLVDYMDGRNGETKEPAAQDGRAHRLMDGTLTFDIAPEVQSLVLYRYNFTQRDSIQIKTLNCTTTGDAQTRVFANNNSTGAFSQPVVLTNILTCRRIEVSRLVGTGTAAAAPLLERMVLLPATSGILTIGTYDNLNLSSYFINSTLLGSASAGNGSWNRFDLPTSSLIFTVDSSVKRMIVYRQMDNVVSDLKVLLSNCVTPPTSATKILSSYLGGAFMWNQPYIVDLESCATVQIVTNVVFGLRTPTGIDSIRLLGAEIPLQAGTYHTKDLAEFFYGANAQYIDPRSQGGVGQRIMDGIFKLNVAPTVGRIVLYRNNYTARDPIRIKTFGCVTTQNFVVTNIGGDADWGYPIVFDLKGCTRVEITREGATSAPVLERIILLPVIPPTLTPGNLYQEYHTGLTFSTGGWAELDSSQFAALQVLPSHRTIFTVNTGANVTFTTTGNRFIVNHRSYTGTSNNVKLCITTDTDTDASCSTYSTNGTLETAQYPVAIFGLSGDSHTTTITNQHNTGYLFIDSVYVP